MPRKKGEQANANGNNAQRFDRTMRGNEPKWLNIRLEPADIEQLERSEATFEFLATSVCALCDDGLGVSVKPVDGGKSFCCTILRPSDDSNSDTYGLSSFGGTLRDTLLTALYKFDTIMGGDFANADNFLSSTKQGQRFR